MTVPNSFATVTSATGAQLDANFAACDQLNAANVRNTDGDQQVISQGTAKLRTGTCSVASGNLYTLLGSNVAVEYTSYNFAISSAGTFAPCDANGATWIRATTAAGIESFYYIVGVGGVAPAAGSFTLEKSFNITTGVETINGSLSIPNATLAIAPATLSTQAVQAGQTMGKNKIINGDFKVNQKAFTSPQTLVTGVPSTGAGYGHDMWRGGASGCTYSFTNANLGLSSVATITAGSLITAIESVNIDATTYVLSWTGTAVARFGVNGAAPSGNFAASPIYITTAVIGAQVSFEFAMSGSLGGSTIVNTGTGTLSLVQMEEGVYKTTYERKLYDQVLRECQRYLPSLSWAGAVNITAGIFPNTINSIFGLSWNTPTRIPITGLSVTGTANVTEGTSTRATNAAVTLQQCASTTSFTVQVLASGQTATSAALLQSYSALTIFGTGAQI